MTIRVLPLLALCAFGLFLGLRSPASALPTASDTASNHKATLEELSPPPELSRINAMRKTDPRRALTQAEKLLTRYQNTKANDPQEIYAYYLIGQIAQSLGLYSQMATAEDKELELIKQQYPDSPVNPYASWDIWDSALIDMGNAELYLGLYAKSICYYQQLEERCRQAHIVTEEIIALEYCGHAEALRGNYDAAKKDYRQAMALNGYLSRTDNKDMKGKRADTTKVRSKKYVKIEIVAAKSSMDKSDEYTKVEAPVDDQKIEDTRIRDKTFTVLETTGDIWVRFGQISELAGQDDDAIVEYQTALKQYQRVALICNGAPDKQQEHDVDSLLAAEGEAYARLAQVYGHRSERTKAIHSLWRSLIVYQQTNDETDAQVPAWKQFTLSNTFHNLMHETKSGDPARAIFFGKAALNDGLAVIASKDSNDFRQQLLSYQEPIYRELADLLIAQKRLPEAEQVLKMLKKREKASFLLDTTADTERIPLNASEDNSANRYKKALRVIMPLLASPPAAQPPPDALIQRLDEATLLPCRAETPDVPTEALKIRQAIQKTLQRYASQNQPVATLETLIYSDVHPTPFGTVFDGPPDFPLESHENDRYSVIITTAREQTAIQIPINESTLDDTILDLRRALSDPEGKTDATRRLAARLYDTLFSDGKVADRLPPDGPSSPPVLLWSLDGLLRDIPLAALYDGHQYLAQRYASAVLSLGTARANAFRPKKGDATWTVPQSRQHWRGLGVGVTELRQDTDLPDLPAVPFELHQIIGDPAHPHGIVPGVVLLDADVSPTAVKDNLSLSTVDVLHIASHYILDPEDGYGIFPLSNGDHLDLINLLTECHQMTPAIHLSLLTLSACETAVTNTEVAGREIDSLGSSAQLEGVDSVLASLLPVADSGTPVLMQEFYRIHEQPEIGAAQWRWISKAEALRQAQMALLLPKGNDPKGYESPYYWSPFVLMGDWH